jgi:uncharacterized protein (TIGR02266 family)
MLAILWDEMAMLQAIQRVLSELEKAFQPPVVSNLSLTLSPAMACLHFNVEFSSYSRAALTHLEGETKRSGGRFIEMLRIPEEKRALFKAQFLMPPGGPALACASFKECARPLLEHLGKLASARKNEREVKPSAQRQSADTAQKKNPELKPPEQLLKPLPDRRAPRFDVNLEVEFKTDADFVREHASVISKGGLFVQTTQRPKINSELGLRIKLPTGQVLETSARVVHVLADGKAPGLGLAFTGDNRLFTEALDKYLTDLQRKK